MENLSSKRHFYLYAKGWYEKKDVVEDLKILMSNYTGVETRFFEASDVIKFLVEIVGTQVNLYEFIQDAHPKKCASVGYYLLDSADYEYDRAMIYCLLANIKYIERGNWGGELGEADENLLEVYKIKGR